VVAPSGGGDLIEKALIACPTPAGVFPLSGHSRPGVGRYKFALAIWRMYGSVRPHRAAGPRPQDGISFRRLQPKLSSVHV